MGPTVDVYGSDVTIGGLFQPHLSGSTITALWTNYDGTDYSIYSSTSTDGISWGSPVAVTTETVRPFTASLVSHAGTLSAVWTQKDGFYFRLYASTSADGGATWSAPVALSNAGPDAHRHRVTNDGDQITVAWIQANLNQVNVSSSTDGATWSAPLPVGLTSNVSFVDVTADGAGLILFWPVGGGTGTLIQSSSSLDGGASWDGPVTLSTTHSSSAEPLLATDGATTTAIWIDDDYSIVVSSITRTPSPGGGPDAGSGLAVTGAIDALGLIVIALAMVASGGILLVRGRRNTSSSQVSM